MRKHETETLAHLYLPLLPFPATDDREETDDTEILHELENIDDDLDAQGIHIVKIADDVAEREYGIEDTPCLVYFEKEVRMTDGDRYQSLVKGFVTLSLFSSCKLLISAILGA